MAMVSSLLPLCAKESNPLPVRLPGHFIVQCPRLQVGPTTLRVAFSLAGCGPWWAPPAPLHLCHRSSLGGAPVPKGRPALYSYSAACGRCRLQCRRPIPEQAGMATVALSRPRGRVFDFLGPSTCRLTAAGSDAAGLAGAAGSLGPGHPVVLATKAQPAAGRQPACLVSLILS